MTAIASSTPTPTTTATATYTPTPTPFEICGLPLGGDPESTEEPICYIITPQPTPTASPTATDPLLACQSIDAAQLELTLIGFGIRTVALSLPTPTPTVTPVAGRIDWTVNELQQVCLSVTHIGLAFLAQTGRTVTPQTIFKEVMGVEENGIRDQGEIELIRVDNSVICETRNGERTITCGNLADYQGASRAITEFVITHEFGHVFDNQADRGNGRTLREYIADTRLGATPTALGTHVGGAILDTNDRVVMGNVALCDNQWLRGERGWGSGPGSSYAPSPNICAPQGQVFTDFQQDPAPYGTDGQANEEATADLFLNWVYRTNLGGITLIGGYSITGEQPPVTGCIPVASQTPPAPTETWIGGGFLNRDPSINQSIVTAEFSWSLPGDIRHALLNDVMRYLFVNHQW